MLKKEKKIIQNRIRTVKFEVFVYREQISMMRVNSILGVKLMFI